jgi:murein DD-endopeptidase MepM/ murein hydrolase activator NlpD
VKAAGSADLAIQVDPVRAAFDQNPRDLLREPLHPEAYVAAASSGPQALVLSGHMSTAPYVLGGIAGLALVKALFRPHRAVVREGGVAACPGPNRYRVCDPSLAIDAASGTPVFSTAEGRVAVVGDRFLQIAAHDEPVVLMYDGVVPSVQEGQYVGRGQQIGQSMGRVFFSVTQFMPGNKLVKVDPSSWLASRGQQIAAKYTGSRNEWCEQGRNIDVPASAGGPCNLYEPERGGFALLPVTVSVER